MRFPWANTILLVALLLQAITGYLGFTSGHDNERWLLWLHGIGAFTMLFILLWKGAVVVNSYRREQAWDLGRTAFVIMALLLALTLLSGLYWTFFGPAYLLGFSIITLHIFLAVALFLPLGWHLVTYRWILNMPATRDRRAFLRAGSLALAGLVTWQLSNVARKQLSLPGSRRRFTGSYETGSFSSNFPKVSWINDDPAPVNAGLWLLQISGSVSGPLTFSYPELLVLPSKSQDVILDCTGGWYSAQSWSGIPFEALLALIRPDAEARSVTFESVTGYSRRFGLEESKDFLLATHVAGSPLEHGHGYPVRLVVPGERGLYWVKWLTLIEFHTTSEIWQSPLPLE